MASRTIRNERERRATAMLTPFMPCGAKIPVIALFAGAFFDDAGWVSFTMYFTGIVLIFLGALLVNKIAGYKNRKSFFIIELPEYKVPSLWFAFKAMCSRGWAYIVKAATIILLCNTAVQIMQTFNWSFAVAETADSSILASIASPFAYLLVPIVGVLSWQLAAAAVTGFIAKENVVGTLAVCFVGLENFIDTDELAMIEGSGAEVAGDHRHHQGGRPGLPDVQPLHPALLRRHGRHELRDQEQEVAAGRHRPPAGHRLHRGYGVYTVGTLITAPHPERGRRPGGPCSGGRVRDHHRSISSARPTGTSRRSTACPAGPRRLPVTEMLADIIIVAVVAAIIGGILFYLYRAKSGA